MSKALQHLKDRYKTKYDSEAGKPQKLDIPADMLGQDVYCRKLITANRKNRIFLALEKEGQIAFCAEMIIQCAIDSEGKRLFNNGERRDLMNACDSTDIEDTAAVISSLVFGSSDIESVMSDKTGDTAEETAATKNS